MDAVLFVAIQEASLVFSAHRFGIAEQRADVAPNSGVQTVHPHLLVVADAVSSETIGIAPHAAVVGVGGFSFRRRAADRLAIVGIAAAVAHNETLQKVFGTALALPAHFLVLCKLLTDGFEQVLTDQGRDGNRDAFLQRRVVGRIGAPRRLGPIALLAETRPGSPIRVFPKAASPL